MGPCGHKEVNPLQIIGQISEYKVRLRLEQEEEIDDISKQQREETIKTCTYPSGA